jgi:hypothetical protein
VRALAGVQGQRALSAQRQGFNESASMFLQPRNFAVAGSASPLNKGGQAGTPALQGLAARPLLIFSPLDPDPEKTGILARGSHARENDKPGPQGEGGGGPPCWMLFAARHISQGVSDRGSAHCPT